MTGQVHLVDGGLIRR
ncbi:hypothetical protein ACF1G5_37800 [Streptomyces coeruleorubidus]